MRKTLKITIGEDGDAEVDVDGFDGRECLDATRDIEEAIGAVEDRNRKPSYYRKTDASRQRADPDR